MSKWYEDSPVVEDWWSGSPEVGTTTLSPAEEERQIKDAVTMSEKTGVSPAKLMRRQTMINNLFRDEDYQETVEQRQEEKKEEGAAGYWSELIDATARGSARVGAAFSQAQAAMSKRRTPGTWMPMENAEQKTLREARSKEYQKSADLLWDVAKHPELVAQDEGKINKAINLVGETIPYITATTVAYVVAGPMGGFAVGSMVEGNSAYKEAYESGVSDKKAKAIGVGVGIVSGAIEAFGGKYAEELLLKATTRLKSKLAKAGAVFTIGTTVEALEEGSQEIAAIAGEETYRDVNWKEAATRIAGSMAGGAFLGGAMRGASIATKRLTQFPDKPVAERGMKPVVPTQEHAGLEKELTKAIQEKTGLPEAEAKTVAQNAIDDKFYAPPEETKEAPKEAIKPPSVPVAGQTQEGATVTPEGKVEVYHGTSKTISELGEPGADIYSSTNIYGQGFYTTDKESVATSYTKKGKGAEPTVHKVSISTETESKLYDMEQPISPEVQQAIIPILEDNDFIYEDTLSKSKNLREVYDDIRNAATSEGMSADETQIVFDNIAEALKKQGYVGLKHKGGLISKGEPHTVRILWNPQQDAALSKPTPAEVQPATTETPAKQPKKLTLYQAQKLGHSLPKKMGWDDAQRRDFMREVTGKTSMKGMTPKEARALVAALQERARDAGVLPPEDYAKTLFVGSREVGTAEFLEEAQATVDKLKDRSGRRVKRMRPRKQAMPGRKTSHIVKAALTGIDNLSISHLMEQIGAAADGILKEVGVTNWRRSVHQIASVFRGGVDMLNDALDKAGITNKDLARMSTSADPRLELIKGVREAAGISKTRWYRPLINGKRFVLSMDELMDMYLCSLQDTGPGHIEAGGFEIRGYKTGAIDEAGMDAIRAIVEADEKAMAVMDAVINIATNYNAPQLNYTEGRLNPETMGPIADKKSYWHLEPKQLKKIRGKQTHNISLLENKNILKPRTGGKQPLVIRGLFPKFFSVQYAVSEYVGMAEELRLMNMILNNDQIIESLEAKGYTEVRDNLKQLLEWVQSKGSTTTSVDKLLGKILHGAYRAVLHYSPEVIMSQYMSTGHYAGVVAPKYAASLSIPPTPKLIKEMLEHNPVAWQRYYAGGQSAELAELGQLDVTLRLLTGKHADLNKTGIAAQLTDLAAFAQGWKIAKAITNDTTKTEQGSLEYWDEVNDKAEELWDTQPNWTKWGKSVNTSQRGVKKALFLFRSYYENSLAMLHSANAKYEQSNKTVGDRAKQAQVYGAVIGSQMATALMRTFMGWGVWRKRKDVWDYLAAMAAAPFGMVAMVGGYMGRVVGNMIKILAGSKQGYEYQPISTLPGKTVEDLLMGIGRMTKASAYWLDGDEEKAIKEAKKATHDLIISTGTMSGIPVRQVEKIIEAIGSEESNFSGGYSE